ncbi:MAG: gliding motility lipoprotein GldD [Bacteroidales bacterium]|nr:gliding motility lipoprotein GldD [Bacteroidales bacterium]
MFITIIVILVVSSCGDRGTPKPRGHFRIDLPEKGYTLFDSICPFTFEYPVYATVTSEPGLTDPCWFNIEFAGYGGKIHLSYIEIAGNLDLLTEDTHRLAYKHTVKADAINESYWENEEKRVYGTLYSITGNAASSMQFYLTDSTNHYLRGALYFSATPDKDSLKPVIDFFSQDVIHLVETLEWKY